MDTLKRGIILPVLCCLFQVVFSQRQFLNVYYSYYDYSVKEIDSNRYRLASFPGLVGVEYEQLLSKIVSQHFGLGYFQRLYEMKPGTSHHPVSYKKAAFIEISAGFKYLRPLCRSLNLYCNGNMLAGVLVGGSKYVRGSTGSSEQQFRRSTVGFSASAGARFRINKSFSAYTECLFRYYQFSYIQDEPVPNTIGGRIGVSYVLK